MYFSHLVFHEIPIENELPEKLEHYATDIENFVNQLLDDIDEKSDRTRSYSIQSDTTEVYNCVKQLIQQKETDQTEAGEIIAKRLHRSKRDRQEQIKHIIQMKKGNLVQVLIEKPEQEQLIYVIAEVEDNDFLDKKTWLRTSGPPYEDCTFRFCKIIFSSDCELVDIFIFDSNGKVADYWCKDFLEFIESKVDSVNTKTAFNSIQQVLNNKVKRKSPQDYTILRNATINYFRTHRHFVYEHLIDEVFLEYQPENPEFEVHEIVDMLRELPEQKGFDRHFNTVIEEIKARISKKYPVSEKIELNIKGDLNDLKEEIYSLEENGIKYLKMQVTDENTYQEFNFKK